MYCTCLCPARCQGFVHLPTEIALILTGALIDEETEAQKH